MEFDQELAEAFREVSGVALRGPVIRLTNQKIIGTVMGGPDASPIEETGFENQSEISIYAPVYQFGTAPDPTAREIITITGGPFDGKWTLIAVESSVAHYTLKCVPLE
jgi:hypothetical protein